MEEKGGLFRLRFSNIEVGGWTDGKTLRLISMEGEPIEADITGEEKVIEMRHDAVLQSPVHESDTDKVLKIILANVNPSAKKQILQVIASLNRRAYRR